MIWSVVFCIVQSIVSATTVGYSEAHTNLDEARHLGSLGVRETHICTGVIFNVRTLITAASCLQSQWDTLVSIDKWNSSTSKLHAGYLIKYRIPHPKYNTSYFSHDIGLAILGKDMKMKDLTMVKIATDDVKPEMELRMDGWNMDFGRFNDTAEKLWRVNFKSLDPQLCVRHYGRYYDDATMFCGDYYYAKKYPETEMRGCDRDLGAPALNKAKELVGISSIGGGCQLYKWPGIYTRASKFKQWIMANAWQAS